MTWERLFAIIQYVVMGIGAAMLWSVRHAFQAGSYSRDLENRLRSVESRMEQAGRKMSDFATDIQGATERYRQIFATLDQHHDLRNDVRELREKIDRRGDDSPWPPNDRRRTKH